MRIDDLPERWKDRLNRYLIASGSKYSSLSASDFQHDVRLLFEDGSSVFIKWAFYLIEDEFKEVGIFTEHCGYHIFPFCIDRIDTIDQNGSILKTVSATIA